MKKIDIDMEVITPMFLAGEDGRAAEIRPPSIKGMIRFWWRAIQSEDDITKLKATEAAIFGGTGDNPKKSAFALRCIADNVKINTKSLPIHKVSVGKKFFVNVLDYLAYGTYEYQRGKGNVFMREYIEPGEKFQIRILIKDVNNTELVEKLIFSFYIFTAFGGIGAKSRNGYGSFRVLNREVFEDIGSEFTKNIVPTKTMMCKLLSSNNLPKYTAFSQHTRLFRTEPYESWDKALAGMGSVYKECRETLENRHSFDKRQYIGAPLDPPRMDFQSSLERRAKPYFLKVIKEDDQKYIGYILYLPSEYCPGLERNRRNENINHCFENSCFIQVCSEFNALLKQKLEEVYET